MRASLLLVFILVLPLLTTTGARPVAARPQAISIPRRDFVAVLTGAKVLPPTPSAASARATFHLSSDGTHLRYRVTVARLHDITLVALRRGASDTTGDIVAILFGPQYVRGATTGVLVEGSLTTRDLTGPLAGTPSLTPLVAAMRQQTVYVDIDTVAYPNGEIRGQVHGDRFGDPHLRR